MQTEDKGQIFPLKQPHICHLHNKIFSPFMRLTRSILAQPCVPFNTAPQPGSGTCQGHTGQVPAPGRDRAESWQGRDNHHRAWNLRPWIHWGIFTRAGANSVNLGIPCLHLMLLSCKCSPGVVSTPFLEVHCSQLSYCA